MTIQPPAELVKEPWFLAALQPRPDFLCVVPRVARLHSLCGANVHALAHSLLAGHMPVRGRDADWDLVRDAIRAQHPDTPILVFGGHTHIRDCVMLDDQSMACVGG